jgi:hypothetical protein
MMYLRNVAALFNARGRGNSAQKVGTSGSEQVRLADENMHNLQQSSAYPVRHRSALRERERERERERDSLTVELPHSYSRD